METVNTALLNLAADGALEGRAIVGAIRAFELGVIAGKYGSIMCNWNHARHAYYVFELACAAIENREPLTVMEFSLLDMPEEANVTHHPVA